MVALAVIRLSSDHRRVEGSGTKTSGGEYGGRRRSGARMRAWSAVPVLALFLLFTFGRPMYLEDYIVKLALLVSGHAQPVAREAWLAVGG